MRGEKVPGRWRTGCRWAVGLRVWASYRGGFGFGVKCHGHVPQGGAGRAGMGTSSFMGA